MTDSPLFWILVVWWILNTFLGAKKRAANATQPPPVDDELEFESSFTTLDETAPPASATQPERPVSSLEQLFNKMGIPEEFKSVDDELKSVGDELKGLGRQLGFIEEEVEFVPPVVVETPPVEVKPEPVIEPELDHQATVRKHAKPKWVPDKIEHVDLMSRIEHLPPLQQAIVLKEVLDRPRAARSGGR